jgi:pimeloyl-ACP methyl ester carboxylesterase
MAAPTLVLVHGIPETAEIWGPLREHLDRDAVALALPGFGVGRPEGFTATKDAYAEWLAATLSRFDGPVDVVAHDVGALLTMRVASAFDTPVRSWVVDVPAIFHPRFTWPERTRKLQTPEVGEELIETGRTVDPDDPRSTRSRLVASGVPPALAETIAEAHDEVMSKSILDFYRSAVPNLGSWWPDVAEPPRSQGLVLLLPDPPEIEATSLEVAERLGAQTARLEGNHCWMAESPERVEPLLERFWSTVD